MNLMGKLRQMLGDDEIQRKPQTRVSRAPSQTRDNQITNRMVDRGQLPANQREDFPQPMQQRRPQGMPLRGSMGNAQNLYSRQPLEATPDSADAFQPVFPQRPLPVQPAMNTYWQNTDGQLRNMVNPQVEDDGYYYN